MTNADTNWWGEIETLQSRIAELERQLVEQYTRFSDLILAGGRLLSEAESRVATLEAALRQIAEHEWHEDHHDYADLIHTELTKIAKAALAASPSKEAAP